MELSCPSCGVKHRTEDHKGAFEINCVCGYAILLPDENAFNPHQVADFGAHPTSLESEDEANIVSLSDEAPAEALPQSIEEFTPSEKLPAEMAYDPFEIPSTPAPLTQNTRAAEKVAAPVAHSVVERALLASVGHFLGVSYDLKIEGMRNENLPELLKSCQKLLEARPWLAQEAQKRGIEFNQSTLPLQFKNVPELLALEIYLAVFELGGRCEYSKSSVT